jgi:hypothetical protein
MTTRSRYRNGNIEFYDNATQETLLALGAVMIYDDFLTTALNTNVWGTRDAGAATEAVVADAPNGVVALALDATSEVQVAGIDWADQRTLVLNQKVIFEARFKLSTLPTGSVVACIGLCGDYNAAVNAVAESVWFRADGNGAITVENDDTSNETSKIATGITVTTADWLVARIDCTNPADVRFYINGNAVATGTTFNMNTVPTLALQPVARIGKEGAATTVGTLQVDYVRVWQNRS